MASSAMANGVASATERLQSLLSQLKPNKTGLDVM